MPPSGAYKKPKNIRKTLAGLSGYLKKHMTAAAAICLLILVNTFANIFGTYLLKPIINGYIVPGDMYSIYWNVNSAMFTYKYAESPTKGVTNLAKILGIRNIVKPENKKLS